MKAERDKTIDIMRGILICLVVLGHAVDAQSRIHQYIYSFHMPCFFLISGYLNVKKSAVDMKEYSKKIVRRYIQPYFIYSAIFFFLTGANVKDIVRTLLGGRWNITVYSFPFWFINVLVLSLVIIEWSLTRLPFVTFYTATVLFWMMAHYFSSSLHYISLPWGIEFLPVSIFYMATGMVIRKFNLYGSKAANKTKVVSLCIMAFMTILFVEVGSVYVYDLNSYDLGDGINDILIPLVSFYSLGGIALLVVKCSWLSDSIEYIGQASSTLFFTHGFLVYIYKKAIPKVILKEWIVSGLCIVSGLLIYHLTYKNKTLKAFERKIKKKVMKYDGLQ